MGRSLRAIGRMLAALAAAMALGLACTATAVAEELPEGLAIAFTEGGADAAGSYAYDGGVLELRGYQSLTLTVTGSVTLAGRSGEGGIRATCPVVLAGTGTLAVPEGDDGPGIMAREVTVGGPSGAGPTVRSCIGALGTIAVRGGRVDAESATPHRHAVDAADVAVSGGTLLASVVNDEPAGGFPIHATGTVKVSGGAVEATIVNREDAVGAFGCAVSGARGIEITGGSVTATIDNAAAFGAGMALYSASGPIAIGTAGTTDGPTVDATILGGGYGHCVAAATVALHSGSLAIHSDVNDEEGCALHATNLAVDGGTLTATATGSASSAIYVDAATVSNATGVPGAGPTIEASAGASAFSGSSALALASSTSGDRAFYPWIVQGGESARSASVLSFAGAANASSTRPVDVSRAGRWLKVQPAALHSITYTTTATVARPGATIALTPNLQFEPVVPTPRFENGLVPQSSLVGLMGTDVYPSANRGSATVTSATLSPSATGRNTAFLALLSRQTLEALRAVYGGTGIPSRLLVLPMVYPVTFDAAGGTMGEDGSELILETQPNGTVDWREVPEPTRDGYVFAGWAPEGGGDPVDLETRVFNEPATLVAQWERGAIWLTAMPGSQVAGGDVALELHGDRPAGEPAWSVTVDGDRVEAGEPTPVPSHPGRYSWAVPANAKVGTTFTITAADATDPDYAASATVTVCEGVLVAFDGNGGAPARQEVTVAPGGSVDLDDVAVPTRDDAYFIGWYGEGADGPERVEEDVLTPAADLRLTAQWVSVDVALDPPVVELAPGDDVADFEVNVTVTPLDDSVSLYEGFSAGAGELELQASGATSSAIEWSAFDYGATARAGVGTRSGTFSLDLHAGVESAEVDVLGAGEVLSSASVRYREPGPSGPGEPLPDVLVTFDGNGGTWGGERTKVVPVPAGAPIGIPEGLVRTGYVCIGFYQSVGGSWRPVDFSTFRATADVTLTALWGTPTLALEPRSQEVEAGDYALLTATIGAVPEDDGVEAAPGAPYGLDPSLLRLTLEPTCATAPPLVDGGTVSVVVAAPNVPGTVDATASYDGSPEATAQIVVTEPPTVAVYRLWNPYDGSHLITSDVHEYETLQPLGWRAEGVRFYQLARGGVPIFRLYNPYNGDHLYTTSRNEYLDLQAIGWRGEDVKLHGSVSSPYPVYRLFNALQTARAGLGAHLWTADVNEYLTLPDLDPKGAWRQEGVAWFAAGLPGD